MKLLLLQKLKRIFLTDTIPCFDIRESFEDPSSERYKKPTSIIVSRCFAIFFASERATGPLPTITARRRIPIRDHNLTNFQAMPRMERNPMDRNNQIQ